MSPKIVDTKQRLAREHELIETALVIMEHEGTAGLTMDKVVAKVPYSKGTVYNHFCSREDLLTGVCNDGMAALAELFARAIVFKGTPRERLLAIHYAYLLHALLDPTRFMLVISAKTANLIERTSEQRLAAHYDLEGRLMSPMLELVDEAITAGELTLPSHMSKQQLVFTNWAGSFGIIALLINSEGKCSGRNGLESQTEVFNHTNLLLDGIQWHPLTDEWNYASTLQRIQSEIFPEESKQVCKVADNPDHTDVIPAGPESPCSTQV